MKESTAIIERIIRLDADYCLLHLAVDNGLHDLKPGQSLLARAHDGWQPYLREQWWPVADAPGKLVVERPGAAAYEPGQVISLLGPVGEPFRYRKTLRNVLFIAHDTPPTPFILAIAFLVQNQVSVSLVLSGQGAAYPTQNLPPQTEILRADADLNWPNRVMTVGWADQAFVAVAPGDQLASFSQVWRLFNELRAEIPRQYLFGLFQPVLPCGVGACQACMLALHGQESCLICADGPALDLTMVKLP